MTRHITRIQWHRETTDADGKPIHEWHEPGEIADLSHIADLDKLVEAGAVEGYNEPTFADLGVASLRASDALEALPPLDEPNLGGD